MVGGGGEGKNCFTSDSQTYNTCKKINKRVMEKTGCLVTTLMLFLRHSKNHTRAPGGKGAAALHHFWSPGAAQSEFKQSWYLAWYFSYQETNGDWVREEFKYQPLPSLETLLIITQFKIPGSILTSDLKPIFEPGTCYSSLEFNTSLQSSLKEKQLSNLKHQLNLVVSTFLQWQIFEKRDTGLQYLWVKYDFSDKFTTCLNALDVEQPTQKTVFQHACCSLKRWLQYGTVRLAKSSHYHIQFACQSEISWQCWTLVKKRRKWGGKGKGRCGGSPPWLSTLQRIWTAGKRNHVSKCQTNVIPAKPHLILLNQQNSSAAWFLLPHQ